MSSKLLQEAIDAKSGVEEKQKPQINPIASAFMAASESAVPGFKYLAAAGPQIQELLSKAKGAYAGPQQSYLPGWIKKEYLKNLDTVRDISNESMAQNPFSNLVGGIGGFMTPGSVGARAYQGVSNIALRGAPQMVRGAGFLKNLGTASNLGLRNVIGGGLASAATGQLMSNLPVSDTQGRGEEAINQGLVGGVLQGGLNATGSTLKGVGYAAQSPYGKAVEKFIYKAPFGVGEWLESGVNVLKSKHIAAQESKLATDTLNAEKKYAASKASVQAEKDLAKEIADANLLSQQKVIQETKDAALKAVSNFQKSENKQIGQQLSNWFTNKAAKFKDTFNELKGSVIKSHGSAKADVGELSGHIDDVLTSQFGINKELSNVDEQVAKIVDPERLKVFKTLFKMKDGLAKDNYTIKELDSVRQQLQGLSDYSAKIQTPYNVLYSDLSKTADLAFKNSLNNSGGVNAVAAYENANQIYSKNIDVYNTLKEISNAAPEKIIKNARTNFTGSFLDTVKTQQPELTKPIKDIIFNDIAQNVKNPQQLTKIIDTYGRDSLKNFLGEAEFSKLVQAEQNLQKAYSAKPLYKEPSAVTMNAKAVKDVVEKQPLPPYISNAVDKALSVGGMLPKGLVPTIINLMLKMK